MREYSLPALAEIPATANLAGTVFRRAAEQPQAVVMRRPDAAGSSGGWADVTASQFRDEVVAVAKGLAAAGITNREIARAVFMSEKTVEAHIARVYRKLGIHSRAELGARMAGNPASNQGRT